MPLRKKYGSKKPYNFSRRSTRKPRFSRKRFNKSTPQRSIIRAPVAARELYVKMKYSTIKEIGSAIGPRYTILGNSLIPFPASYSSNTPTAGDIWVAGIAQYCTQYNLYRVLGCSVSAQYVTESTPTTRIVMVPFTYGGPGEAGAVTTIADKIAELDTLTYDQLSTLPYAYSKLVGSNAGGPNISYMKMFRKTKNMLGCKDLRDNEDTLLAFPNIGGLDGTIQTSSRASWGFYYKVFSGSGSTVGEVQFKISYYVQLSGRASWLPQAVEA